MAVKIPPKLIADASQVLFNMYCSEFTVVDLTDSRGFVGYESVVQDPSAPWLFTAVVDLVLDPVADSSAFASLLAAIQAQIKNLGSEAFSVQQLLFDLDNAGLESKPILSIVSTELVPVILKSGLKFFWQLHKTIFFTFYSSSFSLFKTTV